MFEKNTVLVVGAGASAEFGLPVGHSLLRMIKENSLFEFDYGRNPSKGNRRIFNAVVSKYQNDTVGFDKVFMTLDDIGRGVETAGSIDEYINRYSDDSMIAELGKLLIAYSILEAERSSILMPRAGGEQGFDEHNANDTWIAAFARILFDGVKASEMDRIGEGLTIVCFNYDRCIEHYLERAVMRAYRGIEQQAAREIVAKIDIIHPYGWLGNLDQLSFGKKIDEADLYEVSENLVTWSESVEDRGEQLNAMRAAVASAQNIVFLGFAFANQNMKLLDPDIKSTKPHYTDVYSTGLGLTADVDGKLKTKISRWFGRDGILNKLQNSRIHIKYGMPCKEFMNTQYLNLIA